MAAQKVDIDETSLADRRLAGCLKELFNQLSNGHLNKNHIQALNEHKDPFAPKKSKETDVNDRVQWWIAHYKNLYHINPDFSGLTVPNHVDGFDRLVILPRYLTLSRWVEVARRIHNVTGHKHIDSLVTHNDRSPDEHSYGVWIRDVRDSRDADRHSLAGKSGDDLRKQEIAGITLLERLVAGTAYLFEKMSHMDINGRTLCTGSRTFSDTIPSVQWSDDSPRNVYIGTHVGVGDIRPGNQGYQSRFVVAQ